MPLAVAVLSIFSGCGGNVAPEQQLAALEAGFANPPNSARPRVWWHWMNGNISREGIREDIEWMSRIGIGGLQNFDAALTSPQIVDERLVYMTPPWKQAFRYAAEQADQHGLELAIAGSPGWSETGGPWVAAEDGMKKVVWRELRVEGGKRFDGKLPGLFRATGVFADLEGGHSMSLTGGDHELPSLARTTRVLAFPAQAQDRLLPAPRVHGPAGETLDAGLLTDGLYSAHVSVDRGSAEAPGTILFEYPSPQQVQSLTLFMPGSAGFLGQVSVVPVLQAEVGGVWQEVTEVPLGELPSTVGFSPVTAQRFRLVLKPASAASPMAAMGSGAAGVDAVSMFSVFGYDAGSLMAAMAATTYQVAELSLGTAPMIDQFELKAGYSVAGDYYALAPTEVDANHAVAVTDVVDLTDRVGADGSLAWTPPPGHWRILHLGYSLTGKTNHPAPPEATGLEVDKFDGAAVRRYVEAYLAMYRDATGDDLIGERGLRALLTDSIEVGPANWTPGLIEAFRQRRGYDPTPWLPTLAGVVVGSGAQSDAFLYDFRRTLADLIASEHYGTIAEVLDEQGLTYYSEAVETIRTTLGDDMAMRSHADIPMAAMWTYGDEGPNPAYGLDMKGAASVANVYGQNLVATESLTSVLQPWAHSPASLRPAMDYIFAQGVNRPVIHTSVHQPADDKYPGLALLIFGQYFNRHETWAEMAGPWVDYVARSSFLLQQGRGFADVAYFYGEEAPLTQLFKDGFPDDAPTRYGYDFINADALLEETRVDNGELVTSGGARYRLLYLGGASRYMTVPVLRRLAELVEQGVTVVGRAPEATPSLADDGAEFATLVARLWHGEAPAGTARVIDSTDVEAVLGSRGVIPDFSFEPASANSEILFQHRRLDIGDIYYLSNRRDHLEAGEARFRVIGKQPQLWRADTGEMRPVSYRTEGDATVIDLAMAARDSFFVVFIDDADAPSARVTAPRWVTLADVGAGPWTVRFQPGRGAPASIELGQLASLSEHPAAGVRYFSGVASYRRSFELPPSATPGAPLQIDLGAVGDVAEVYVNGEKAGTAWRAPYRVEIGSLVKPGVNTLEVRVANLWVNRLIGDRQPGVEPVTWTSTPIYLPEAPLRPAGLLGPVSLLSRAE